MNMLSNLKICIYVIILNVCDLLIISNRIFKLNVCLHKGLGIRTCTILSDFKTVCIFALFCKCMVVPINHIPKECRHERTRGMNNGMSVNIVIDSLHLSLKFTLLKPRNRRLDYKTIVQLFEARMILCLVNCVYGILLTTRSV